MNVARRSDGLLSAEQLAMLLGLVGRGAARTRDLCQSLRALAGAAAARTENTLEVLREIGVATRDNDIWSFEKAFGTVSPAERPEAIRNAVTGYYASRLSAENVGTSFQAEDNGDLWVDSLQLPLRELGYPFMLVALGIAERELLSSRFWRVMPTYAPAFMAALRALNTSRTANRSFGEKRLAALQAAQTAAGRQAEEWVTAYERNRVARHVFKESIRRISEADVTAGFDILSFDSHQSLVHDRFIEVKSFRDEPHFHWSKGEMETAKELRGRYWLYLVDRACMSDPGYEPDMIADPAAFFLERKPDGWSVAEEGFLFTRS